MYSKAWKCFSKQDYKKKEITSESYYTGIIAYIHLDPVSDHLVNDCEDW